jgi:aminomethyltransferase
MIPLTHYETPLLPTPFHSRTSALCHNNDWGRWAGYTVPNSYGEVELEYFAVRNTATLFDLSPMMKYRIAGPDAERYLNRLLTRDVRKLKPGRVAYSLWCDDEGHVLDDGTLFRFAEDRFRLCSQERQLVWLTDSAAGFDVEIEDVTEKIAALALQGPTSAAVLRRMGIAGIDDLRPFAMIEVPLDGGSLTLSRTGFTGDLGYELWIEPGLAEPLWDRLMSAGTLHGLRPIGSRALDLARIEAGFIATNADYVAGDQIIRRTRGRSPFELGLGRLVDFDKGHFNGRRTLLAERERGSRYALVGLDIEGNKPAGGALVYHKQKTEAGHITSAMWSPTCKRNLALASLKAPYGSEITDDFWVEIYVLKELQWDKQMVRARIVERPFFNPERRRATPPHDF